jgi:hypothetical protein
MQNQLTFSQRTSGSSLSPFNWKKLISLVTTSGTLFRPSFRHIVQLAFFVGDGRQLPVAISGRDLGDEDRSSLAGGKP